MWWRLLQIAVFLSVSFTGIYYEWTPNGLVLSLVSATCAFAATVLLGDFFRLVRWSTKKLRPVLSKQRTN
jgi:hypothetical protein